jgi:multiple RNA-binding domain-containing protein 1
MAVRMALGETHIIQETKKYLEEEGIRLEAFEGRKKRSNTVIIVKNIPFEVTVDDIRAVFDKFGVLGRVCVVGSALSPAMCES